MKLDDPGAMPRGARRFIAYWLRDNAAAFDNRGFTSLIPTTLLVCLALGTSVGLYATDDLWKDLQNSVAFYAAVLAVSAILLAVCWAAFARMLDTLSDPSFGGWMRLHKLDGLYGFYIDYIQLTQLVSVATAGAGLVVSILPASEWINRAMLGATVATAVYAARWSAGCVHLMQDLSEHRATFKDQQSNVSTLTPGLTG